MTDLTRTALAIHRDLLERFDAWMDARGYANRSEAMRDLIRRALIEQQWAEPDAAVVAVLSIIYDHHAHDLAQRLTEVQHRDHSAILCSQHVHLDHHLCMEVILMQGTAGRLREMADAIIATRGVKAGELTLMSRNV